jgi:SAM-dependent methyltransferase
MSDDPRGRRLAEYYEQYDESTRLTRSKSHQLEFLTTDRILQRYLAPRSTILDLGAGPGCYTFHYARLGHRVVARDRVVHSVELMHANPLCRELGVDVGVADARDLSEFSDGAVDAVLCFGPLYHTGESEDRRRCLSECLRVLKSGGILAIAYILKFFVYAHLVTLDRTNLTDGFRDEVMSRETMLSQDPESLWFFDSPEEVEDLLASYDVERLANAGTDGIAMLLADTVDTFDNAELEQWLKYHYATCEEPSILGYSNHGLYVCRKR